MNVIRILSTQPWVERLGWTLVHFLWQGLAIAALYAVARASARHSSPHRRYLLACVALAALLVAPIATYSLLGSPDVAPPAAHAAAPTPNSDSGTVFAASAGEAASAHATIPGFSAVQVLPSLVILWLAGALIFWVRLAGGWMASARLRTHLVRPAPREWQAATDRLKARLRVSHPVRLLVSAWVEAPAVVGWLRPVILVPVGALAGLPAEHLEALLLHELAHIRRHDYLVNVLQSIAEAQLFYHPAVWWISGHIRAERELCCDDLAVAATGDAFTYASALADLEACRPAHAHHAVAANGGRLVDRIARLLGQSRPQSRIVSAPAAATSAILLALTACVVLAQSAERPKFEVASVKPEPTKARSVAGMRTLNGGRLRADNATVQFLIMKAYHLQDFQIVGGPNWLGDEGFDIEAKGDPQATRDQLLLMLQSLLEERFQLKYHHETRELPVYALSVDSRGSKLPAPKEGGCVNGDGSGPPRAPSELAPPQCGIVSTSIGASGWTASGADVPMSAFIQTLSSMLARPVLDRTGITAHFDVHLTFAADETVAGPSKAWGSVQGHRETLAAAAATSEVGGAPSILVALREQLGLKLGSTKGPVEVMVIDRVEKPSAN